MLLFAVTGVTLNHAGYFEGEPQTQTDEFELSLPLADQIGALEDGASVPISLTAAIAEETGINLSGRSSIVEFGEVTFDLSGPGVSSYLAIDAVSGFASYERIDRGTVAILNDLHKGRDSGLVWGALIDIAAIVCILFCLTGFALLWLAARARPSTWPLTSLGLLIPLIAYILFAHA